jgi:DNA-binding GntR family transcriptional regulator
VTIRIDVEGIHRLIILDRRTPVPLYFQLVQQLESAIMAGKLKPGDRLPSMDRLAIELRVSLPTVRHGVAVLEQQGRLVRRHGHGTYVADDS